MIVDNTCIRKKSEKEGKRDKEKEKKYNYEIFVLSNISKIWFTLSNIQSYVNNTDKKYTMIF